MRTFVPRGGRVLIPATGAYADRAIRLAREIGCDVLTLPGAGRRRRSPDALEAALAADPSITHAILVYSETGSGVVHDAAGLARAAGRAGRRGDRRCGPPRSGRCRLEPVGAADGGCGGVHGQQVHRGAAGPCLRRGAGGSADRVPGARREAGRSTWPTSISMRCGSAGAASASRRRRRCWPRSTSRSTCSRPRAASLPGSPATRPICGRCMTACGRWGLRPCLPPGVQGPIVVNVYAPDHPGWNLQAFVDAVKMRGFLISNFYNTEAPSFRVGCIGAITARGHAQRRRRDGRGAGESGHPGPPGRVMRSDLEIADAAVLRPIAEIAGVAAFRRTRSNPMAASRRRLGSTSSAAWRIGRMARWCLVTGISPTPAGEGKTTTTIGLGDALRPGRPAGDDLPAGAVVGAVLRRQGRRDRGRDGAGGADGGDQPAFHPVISTRSPRPTTCSPRWWTTICIGATNSASTRAA